MSKINHMAAGVTLCLPETAIRALIMHAPHDVPGCVEIDVYTETETHADAIRHWVNLVSADVPTDGVMVIDGDDDEYITIRMNVEAIADYCARIIPVSLGIGDYFAGVAYGHAEKSAAAPE